MLLKVQTVPRMMAGRQDRAKERQGDGAERLAAGRAVDLGGFVVLVRDALEAAEDDDHHERDAEPDVRDDHRREVPERVRQPREGTEADEAEELVHRSVLVVELGAPDQQGDDLGHGPGQDDAARGRCPCRASCGGAAGRAPSPARRGRRR